MSHTLASADGIPMEETPAISLGSSKELRPDTEHVAIEMENQIADIGETAELESWNSVKSIYHVALLDYYLVFVAKLPTSLEPEDGGTHGADKSLHHALSEFFTLDNKTAIQLNRCYRILLLFAALFSQIILPIAFLNQWITDSGAYHTFNTIVRPPNGPPDIYTQIAQGVVGCFVVFSTAMENWESLRLSTHFISNRTVGHLIPILIFYTLYLVVEFILFVAFMLILRSETPLDAVLNGVGILCVLDIDRLLSLPLSKLEKNQLSRAVRGEGSKRTCISTRWILNASRIVLLMAKMAYWIWFLSQIRINGNSADYPATPGDLTTSEA